MPVRDSPPFRADHVGSLLRPPELPRARAHFRAGEIDGEALRAIEDDAIADVIELQPRAAERHRWRIQAQLVADGLHLLARGRRAG